MTLPAVLEAPPRLLLNVASSTHLLPGFVNLDNSPFILVARLLPFVRPLLGSKRRQLAQTFRDALRTGTLLQHDCRRPLPFRSGTVDHLLCSHYLEHVYPDQAETILRDLLRALKVGATAHFVLPDLALAVNGYRAEGSADRLVLALGMTRATAPSVALRLLEVLGWEGLQHRWMYDSASFTALVERVGFEVIPEPAACESGHWRREDGESFHVFARRRS